jgi:outer membrane protein TolC
MEKRHTYLRHVCTAHAWILVGLALNGCASLSPDAGFRDVQKIAASRLDQRLQWNRSPEERKAADELTQSLLAQPLSADAAVQIALLNNRGLQASYGELGVAQAEVVRAGRAANPVFSAQRWSAGERYKSEIGIEFNFLSLLLIPLKLQEQQANFEYTKLKLGEEVFGLAQEVRTQYFVTLAAAQEAVMQQAIVASAEAAAELAERQNRAGNLSLKRRAKHEVIHAEAASQATRLRRRSFSEREKLSRLMGLRTASWALPGKLPEIPADPPRFEELERLALEQRLDVQAARQELEVAAGELGVTKATRFGDSVMIGYGSLKESDEPTRRGPSLELELPLFDQGGSRVYRDTTRLRQSEDRLAETVIRARSEVRERHNDLLAAHEQAARVQKSIVPLRRRMLAQTQLAYNGMLEGIYDLLESYRESVLSGQMAIDAVKDYWIALAELERAVGGRLPAPLSASEPGAPKVVTMPAEPAPGQTH